jgi:hypothetical protein
MLMMAGNVEAVVPVVAALQQATADAGGRARSLPGRRLMRRADGLSEG